MRISRILLLLSLTVPLLSCSPLAVRVQVQQEPGADFQVQVPAACSTPDFSAYQLVDGSVFFNITFACPQMRGTEEAK